MAQLSLTQVRHPSIGAGIAFDSLVRSILLAAVFFLLWISFQPFPDISGPPEVSKAGNVINEVGYSLLFLLLAAWCFVHQPARLALLARPILIATLLWFVLCVATSWEPLLSARRLAFTFVTIGIAGMTLLLPNNIRHFSAVIAGVALTVLALCYFGVAFLPTLSIHQASDFSDEGLVGDWRGVFGHKNEASAVMVVFIFIGLFVARARNMVLGAAIAVLALAFLIFTHSRTSIIMLPVVLIVSMILPRIRRPIPGVLFVLSILVALNTFSVGSIYFEPVHKLLDSVLADASFTGRTEIWQFATSRMMERPITGYGYAAFWNTPEVVYGMDASQTWANEASHAHNGYLDLALTVGIPGAALVVLWLVVLPIIDFYRSPHRPATAPLELLFLRVCLFAAYASAFESLLLREGGAPLLLIAAAFGLRFLSVSPAKI